MNQTVRDWLAMGRVANLPTVVSNVLLGMVLGAFPLRWIDWAVLPVPLVAACLLYLGGCYLNDWWDRKWDAANKNDRPLPMGRIAPGAVLLVASVCLAAGLALAATLSLETFLIGLLIVGLIILYTALHKKTPWAVLPMGGCRAGLYLFGISSQIGLSASRLVWRGDMVDYYWWLFAPPLGILAYIGGLSLCARQEAKGQLHRSNVVLASLLLFSPLVTHLSCLASNNIKDPLLAPWVLPAAMVPFIAAVVWGLRVVKKSIGGAVSIWLASIGLLDFLLLFPVAFAAHLPAPYTRIEGPLPSLLLVPGVALAAFLLARLLQRLAPAT
ncbi:MAG: UbiA family prenyltransferase [Verrucomicrobiota bacterium JB023]|nr:UbiA family prenyltransferase [Verrucomicrobiota bacterium JB023]